MYISNRVLWLLLFLKVTLFDNLIANTHVLYSMLRGRSSLRIFWSLLVKRYAISFGYYVFFLPLILLVKKKMLSNILYTYAYLSRTRARWKINQVSTQNMCTVTFIIVIYYVVLVCCERWIVLTFSNKIMLGTDTPWYRSLID